MSVALAIIVCGLAVGFLITFGIWANEAYMDLGEFLGIWAVAGLIAGTLIGLGVWGLSCYRSSEVKERLSTYIEHIAEKPAEEARVEETAPPSETAEEVEKFDFGADLSFGGGDFGGEKR
jgi:hypothetical protein